MRENGILNGFVNSLSPSDAYKRQGTGLALVYIMACCLFGYKALPKSMLIDFQRDHK